MASQLIPFKEMVRMFYEGIKQSNSEDERKPGGGEVDCWDWCENTYKAEYQDVFSVVHETRWMPHDHPLAVLMDHPQYPRNGCGFLVLQVDYFVVLIEREVMRLLRDICVMCKGMGLPHKTVVDDEYLRANFGQVTYVNNEEFYGPTAIAEGSADDEDGEGEDGYMYPAAAAAGQQQPPPLLQIGEVTDTARLKEYLFDYYSNVKKQRVVGGGDGALPRARDFYYDMFSCAIGEDVRWIVPEGHLITRFIEESHTDGSIYIPTEYGLVYMYTDADMVNAIRSITQQCAMFKFEVSDVQMPQPAAYANNNNNNNNVAAAAAPGSVLNV